MEKRIVVFDLDGTLAESKSEMDNEMSRLLAQLLSVKEVAVISGGSYKQFETQFLKGLKCPLKLLKKLYLFPTCATQFYKYNKGWNSMYIETLSREEKNKILAAFSKALKEVNLETPKKVYGDILEDRGTQITFSALGQQAPIELKKAWDPDTNKRQQIKKALDKYLPEFEVRIGGTTSIDVTKKGIDKAYGIKQIEKHLSSLKEEIIFVGDALFEGGNDYPVKQLGIECISVSGPEQTKQVILNLLKESIK